MSLLKKQSNADKSRLLLKYCVISGALACGIMLLFYLLHSNSLLFGDSTVLRMDLYHQYGPLYAELYDRLVQGRSLIYSWTSGLGNSFLGNLFNYCSSPFALVILILGHKNMPEAIAIMILLKAVFAAVSFTYYINKSSDSVKPASIGFAMLYTFCGYFVAFSWNIMWLDAMAVFPLVMLGIENIINRRSPTLYICAMIYTMLTNYYMAYMVCIISVLWFLFYYFANYPLNSRIEAKRKKTVAESVYSDGLVVREENAATDATAVPAEQGSASDSETILPEESDAEVFTEQIEASVPETASENKPEKKRDMKVRECRFFTAGVIFAASSVLCFFVAAFALIPVLFCLRTSSATGSAFPSAITVYYNVFDFIANHLPSLETTIRSSGSDVLPNVYCGMITILLLPAFLLTDKIKARFKIAAVLLLAVYYFSFNLNTLNYIWHGFHFPNDLPYRYSFAYSFFLLILAYRGLQHIADFSRKYFITTGISMIAFLIMVQKLGSKNVNNGTLMVSLVFVVAYVILAGLITSNRFTMKNLQHLLVIMIVIELVCSDTTHFIMSQSKSAYTSDYDAYQQISQLAEKDETDLFYRTELSKLRARMDPSWYGYNGVSVFSSMAYQDTSALMKSLGLFGNNINSYTYYPQTPVFNAFFSVKYVYDNAKLLKEGFGYKQIAANDNFTAYKNEYCFPLAFSVNDKITEWEPQNNIDPFENQNSLVSLSAGVEDVLEPVLATDVTSSNLDSISLSSVNTGTTFSANKVNTSQSATVKVIIDVEEQGRYFVYAGSTRLSSIKFTAGDDLTYNYISSSIQPFILDMGERAPGEQIAVEYTVDESYASATLTFCAAKLNTEKFEDAYNIISSNGTFSLESFDETSLSGKIKVNNANAFVFTSIPYDKSWEVYVDGERLQYMDPEAENAMLAVGNGLLGFRTTRGEHTVQMRYQPRGLKLGRLVSMAGIVICTVLLVLKIVFTLKKRKEEAAVISLPNESAM